MELALIYREKEIVNEYKEGLDEEVNLGLSTQFPTVATQKCRP